MRRTLLALAIVLVVVTGVATVGFAGTVGASDSATILEVAPEAAEAPPGETIHVAIEMLNDGGYGGVGVERVAFGIEYDSDVLTVEEVTRGPWLEQGDETEIATEVDVEADAGSVAIDQYRDPAEGGASGSDRAATVTFSIAEDADGETSPVNLTAVETDLTNDWPQYAFTHNGSVSVDESADVVDASPADRSPDYVSESTSSDSEPAEAKAEATDERDDPIPGFGVAAAVAALVVLSVAAARAIRDS